MSTITLTLGDDGIALLAIDVPGRPQNVFTEAFAADLADAVERVATDPSVKGAVITSGKAGGFMVGADLKDLVGAYERGVTAAEAAEWAVGASRLYRRMETCGKPFAAAINGLALGGGFELCLACHHRVLAEDSKGLVGLPEVTVGLLPGAGGTQRLPRLIGIERALPLLLDGTRLAPADALQIGVVDALAPAEEVVAHARAWVAANPEVLQPWDRKGFQVPGGAGPLAPHAGRTFMVGTTRLKSATRQNYPAPLAILSAVFEGTQVPIDVGLRIEAKYFGTLLSGPVARNLMRTLFINKGRADKLERRPAHVPKATIRKLGVLGAGMMGAGIAHVAAAAEMEVVLLDRTEDTATKGRCHAERMQARDVERGRTTREEADAVLARIVPTTRHEDLADCDLVVEAVFESRPIKAEVIQAAEAVMPAHALLASNTSTLSITSLAQTSNRPDRFIGIHFFSPVERMPLVEVIVGERTSAATIAHALDFVAQLRKTPVVVNDSPGFYTSRVFCSYIDEGMAMLADGVAPALIENAARMAGMATAPLAVTDEVSLDLQLLVVRQAEEDGLPDRFRRLHAQPVIRAFNDLGRLGRKTGGGFYDYPVDGRKRLWGGLRDLYPARAEQPDVEEVKKRLLYIQALESARCLEESVITHAADADIASILGLGFPTWTGGALSLIDTVGIGTFVEECRRFAGLYGPRFQPSGRLVELARRGEGLFQPRVV